MSRSQSKKTKFTLPEVTAANRLELYSDWEKLLNQHSALKDLKYIKQELKKYSTEAFYDEGEDQQITHLSILIGIWKEKYNSDQEPMTQLESWLTKRKQQIKEEAKDSPNTPPKKPQQASKEEAVVFSFPKEIKLQQPQATQNKEIFLERKYEECRRVLLAGSIIEIFFGDSKYELPNKKSDTKSKESADHFRDFLIAHGIPCKIAEFIALRFNTDDLHGHFTSTAPQHFLQENHQENHTVHPNKINYQIHCSNTGVVTITCNMMASVKKLADGSFTCVAEQVSITSEVQFKLNEQDKISYNHTTVIFKVDQETATKILLEQQHQKKQDPTWQTIKASGESLFSTNYLQYYQEAIKKYLSTNPHFSSSYRAKKLQKDIKKASSVENLLSLIRGFLRSGRNTDNECCQTFFFQSKSGYGEQSLRWHLLTAHKQVLWERTPTLYNKMEKYCRAIEYFLKTNPHGSSKKRAIQLMCDILTSEKQEKIDEVTKDFSKKGQNQASFWTRSSNNIDSLKTYMQFAQSDQNLLLHEQHQNPPSAGIK
jgi:hypothetical protein